MTEKELAAIKAAHNPEKTREEKEKLEELMANAHTSEVKVDMSKASEDLNYFTNLLTKIDALYTDLDQLDQAKTLVVEAQDAEMKELAQLEIPELEEKIVSLDQEITDMKIARKFTDPDDMKSVVLEVRAGAGGEEAALFAADLYRMYKSFATNMGWPVEIIDDSVSENGGYKEIIAQIKGKNAYKLLKYESGVHRVQRIPSTESNGRIHTSTASVAILPEAEEVDLQLDEADLRVDTMRASGAGGQHVNKTSSAVRITHIPTGVVVFSQESRLQQQNRAIAMQLLRTRLYEKQRKEEMEKRSDLRSGQIGQAMRAEKIRTYNYPQSRITDHRIKESWHNLEEAMNGNIKEILETVNEKMLRMMLESSKETSQQSK